MKSLENLLKGKQIGYEEVREIGNTKIYYSVAVQKWEDKFKIYMREIEEDKFSIYEDIEDDVVKMIQVNTIEEVMQYFKEVLQMDLEQLHPLKGQRIFNPRF